MNQSGSPSRSPLKTRGSSQGSDSPRIKRASTLSPVGRKLAVGESSPQTRRPAARLDEVISSARKNFLFSTDQVKSPQKRPHRDATPSPLKVSSNHIGDQGVPLSPASLKKAGVGSPPKKKPKLWKSKWQLATLSGGFSETGKKKRASEASRLLDDEGVIHMLNRVPSVYGMLPTGPSNTNLVRVQRARNATTKPKAADIKQKLKPVETSQPPAKRTSPVEQPVQRSTAAEPLKVEENQPQFQIKDLKQEPEEPASSLSPRRAVRSIQASTSSIEARGSLTASKGAEDGFGLLQNLPAEQLELLANCDIRYSLPSQGLPVAAAVAASPVAATRTAADLQRQLRLTVPAKLDSPPLVKSIATSKPLEVRLVSPMPCSGSCSCTAAGSLSSAAAAAGSTDRLAYLRSCIRGEAPLSRAGSTPGSYSHIFLRFYEDFVQITLAASGARLAGSLSPPVIDEIIQAVNYVAGDRRYRGILLTGVGAVFCQGVDLLYLANDRPDKRKEAAKELAEGVERLVLCLASFPKLLIAAVNGLACGLGLSLLPLCDLVYASDKATFNSLASRLGHIPEGGVATTFSNGSNGVLPPLLAEIFLFGRTATGSELAALGCINGLFLAGRFMEETIPRIRRGMAQTSPSAQWNKLLFKQGLTQMLERVLPVETSLLAEMWSSQEFHRNLVHFLNTDKCLHFRQQSKQK